MTSIRLMSSIVAAACCALPATAQTEAWTATSTTSIAITGDVTITADAITFATGTSIGIRAAGPDRPGVYVVDPPSDPVLLNGNTLCGGGAPVTYVVLGRGGPNSLYLKVFDGSEMPEASDAVFQPGMCASYNFERMQSGNSAASSSNGISRESVAEIQHLLNELGYQAGSVDGFAGKNTRRAIHAYQQAAGLPATGAPADALIDSLKATIAARAAAGGSDVPASVGELAGVETFQDCEQCPEMVTLPTGTFTMGLTADERKHSFIGTVPAELPAHEVNIGYRFAIGKYEVTTAQFDAYVRETGDRTGGVCAIRLIEQGPNALKYTGTRHPGDTGNEFGPYLVYINDGSYAQPGLPVSPDQPAVCVSRLEIAGYLDWLSEKTGRKYRLPSEAEWEYAARAGTRTIGFWGNDFAEACGYANFGDKRSGYQAGIAAPCAENARHEWTAPAGSYKPNAWGIHDMAGNVQELTADCWHENYDGAPADGSPWTEPDCSLWVARGGDYELMFVSMRAAERLFYGYVPEAGGVEGSDAGDNGRSNVGGFRIAVTLE